MFSVKPLQVKIIADSKRLEAGQEVTFQCIVYGARPQPTITWSLVDDETQFNDLNNNADNFIENELSSSSSYFDSTNWYRDTQSNNAISKNSTNFKNRTNEKVKFNDNRTFSSVNKLTNQNDLAGLSFQAAKKAAITQVLSEVENIHSSQIRFRLNEK